MNDTETKLTKKQSYEKILETLEGTDVENKDELMEFVKKQIATLISQGERAKARAAAKKAEGDELREAVKSVLTSELQTADEIFAKVEGEDLTIAKVRARLTQLVSNGDVVKEDVTIDSKTKKAYKLA